MTTKTNMALAELAKKGADSDLLREMIQYVAQRMVDMDVSNLCAAAYAERNPERLNSRNGYRELRTRAFRCAPWRFNSKMLELPLQLLSPTIANKSCRPDRSLGH
jgi:hypothetical protein